MKELKGQFKTDFEIWLTFDKVNQDVFNIDSLSGDFSGDLDDIFYRLPMCAQFGVVQLFADSVGYVLRIDTYQGLVVFKPAKADKTFNNRPEAQQEAITQFEKWYNENK